jgi:hypothetical protein
MRRHLALSITAAAWLAFVPVVLPAEQKDDITGDSPQHPRVGTITVIEHDLMQVKFQTGETTKYKITAHTQIGTPEQPMSFLSFKIGNIVTVTAKSTDSGLEAVEVFPGNQLLYFVKRKRAPAANAAPVRAGNVLLITADQLVLRTTGGKDFKYTLTPKTRFGSGKNRMKPSHFPPGSLAKIIAVKGDGDTSIATEVQPFIQDVGSRRQAPVRQDTPQKVKPTPECRGFLVAVATGHVEIRAKSSECFKYTVTAATILGTQETPLNLLQFRPGNFVKIRARVGDSGTLEALQITHADYRK